MSSFLLNNSGDCFYNAFQYSAVFAAEFKKELNYFLYEYGSRYSRMDQVKFVDDSLQKFKVIRSA